MGSRGAFVNVSIGDFRFNIGTGQNQQTYKTIGVIDEVQVIVQDKGQSVKAPDYSHTANRTYAVIQNGKLKHLAFYDENHNLVWVIDFGHMHNEKKPHVHYDKEHKLSSGVPTDDDWKIIKKFLRRYNVTWQ